MNAAADPLRPIWWDADGVGYIDQRALPDQLRVAHAADGAAVLDAIASSAVAGSRCVRMFCAFGAALSRMASPRHGDDTELLERLRAAAASSTMETNTVERILAAAPGDERTTALTIIAEARDVDRAIATHAASLLLPDRAILTLGSSGALSTGGQGTALGAMIAAHVGGQRVSVYICETRPRATGLRLAAFECAHAGVPHRVIPDGAAATLMKDASIAAIIVGASAMAANGDTVAEIGTYALAVAAAHHRIPFYVALPRADIDFACRRGDALPASVASRTDRGFDRRSVVATGSDRPVRPFAADLTPGHLITAVVTEYGIVKPPYVESLSALTTRPRFVLTQHA